MSDETSGKISIEDAIRLKHDLNQNITHGGYSAKQIREMESLTKEQYAEVNRQLAEIKKTWWFFPNYFWAIGILCAGFCILYFSQLLVQVIGLVILLYCTAQFGYRSGVLYGYVRGYEGGHEEGVHKSLGITAEGATDIHDRAIEMEMDEKLIKRMDERKEEST